VTADARLKQRLAPLLGRFYRLAYNLFALVSFALVWLVGLWVLPDPQTFDLPAVVSWGLYGLTGLGAVGLIIAARTYDLSRFAGTAQMRHRDEAAFAEDEPLLESGLHGWVRHPIYAFVFPLVWGLAQDERSLATAIWISAYLIIGARFEENRLIALYGETYLRYRSRVPAFFPNLFRV
jgi:protein-S-isoprenylcysteine O-methyltransferase Ste14